MAKKNEIEGMPSREAVLDFIKGFEGRVTKRDIARAFDVKGPDKVQLKKLLREMTDDGLIAKDFSKSLRPSDRLPSVQVVEFAGLDREGEAFVKPVNWEGEGAPPKIALAMGKRHKGPAMGPGDRALVRLREVRRGETRYQAEVLKILPNAPASIMGVFHGGENGGRIHPIDKKNRDDYLVAAGDTGNAIEGELVVAMPVRKGRERLGPRMARVTERLGDVSDARSISLIAIHAYDIPHVFPADVIKAAKAAKPVVLGDRTDLRDIPLITIDPADARDHDDAIWAEADTDAQNKGGWHTIVAIADVAHYVTPDSALDVEAKKRGNSCYFPDRVVPMLPEELSADLCSLMPGVERACLAVHMWFDAEGNKIRHKFVRGLMRSAANIHYAQAQAALDGITDETTAPLLDSVLKPLHSAWKAIMMARAKREPLDLDMPERKIELGENGHVARINVRERLDTHRVVEEFMIMANVAAAEELEKHRVPAMYRVHEEPAFDKIEALSDFLRTLDLPTPKGQVMMPRLFNGLLKKVSGTPVETMVNEVVLRSQTQAYYSPDNLGHFGLALQRYAHFTSPIRRYSDLVVHRGLIRALKLGKDGLTEGEIEEMTMVGEHISSTERRAMAAERDSTARYIAAYLGDRIGDYFEGRITGVNKFGLFVLLEPSCGDGLIPISQLGADFYRHDETHHSLIGERTGETFRLGDRVEVKLLEANPFTGGLRLEMAGERHPGAAGPKARRMASKGRRSPKRGGGPQSTSPREKTEHPPRRKRRRP
ncbi:ribonuclease R [Gimibacter soli]|uniref:Ribonuclease R n=1 Tax=Gimibacter soli TaxID=3024400 RepID=A0AAE9XR01_9PROT|nr:ribonuclease R [Gimibacter soli]WCL55703.1 ribonuclease R [Gimibacter soli]